MDNKLKGITANKNSVQISFMYDGMRCRETIKAKPTKTILKETVRKREAILYEISTGNFNYSKHFPNSKKAYELANQNASTLTINEMINNWIKRNQKDWEYSTIRGYLSKIKNHIESNFGHMLVNDFKPTMLKDWGTTVKLSGKSKNEVRSILRLAFQELYLDEVIDSNPIDRVKRFKHIKAEPEPFNDSEREKILAQMSGQVRNLYEFAFWTGLRTSELLALRKCDIDLERKVIFVRKALVHGREKGTKSKSGERTHELHPKALEVLQKQIFISSIIQERLFLNPKNQLPWKDDRAIYHNHWVPALKKSGVKFRKQYNTRHTYASLMLTQNMPIAWLAKQLGHSDIGMTLSTYARWISNNN